MGDDLLIQAIALIKAGKTNEGAALLRQHLQADSRSEMGWLWMTACVETNALKCDCLNRALEINPENIHAREALQKMGMAVDAPTVDRILSAPEPVKLPTASVSRISATSDFIPAVCPNCGGKLQENPGAETLVCQYCGTEHLVRHNINGALTLEAYARCPICQRNDRAEKVSAILHNQTARTEGVVAQQRVVTGPGGRIHTQNVNVPVQTTQMSDLARRLSPPVSPPNKTKPKISFTTLLLIGGISFLLFGICALISTLSNSSSTGTVVSCTIIPLALSIVLLVVWFLRLRKSNTISKQAQSQPNDAYKNWQQAYARWEKLYYCGRDDVIFLPGEKTSAPVADMMVYVHSFPHK